MRGKPAGTIRIVASDFAINCVLWPKLKKFLTKYPDIKVELSRDNGLTDGSRVRALPVSHTAGRVRVDSVRALQRSAGDLPRAALKPRRMPLCERD